MVKPSGRLDRDSTTDQLKAMGKTKEFAFDLSLSYEFDKFAGRLDRDFTTDQLKAMGETKQKRLHRRSA